MKRYAFILPRFFEDIAGGAETLSGELAAHLKKQGHTIEIWTTCAKDNRTWENTFEPGKTIVNGIAVNRFTVDERDLDTWIPLQIRIAEGMQLTVDEQLDWMRYSVNSLALYDHIRLEAKHYDALFFAPYLFGTTFWGALIAPEKSVLIPCLHDESYAYLDIMQHLFKRVRGALFNAIPEQHLAERLYGTISGGEVGMGFYSPNAVGCPPYFDNDSPYLLYAGRKETGKNVHLLVDGFIAAKESEKIASDSKLVIIGGGDFADLHRSHALARGDIIDLGHVSEVDKLRLMKHATAFVQPSVNESFSIVIMESWLLGTPVIVHGHCAVTRHHVLESKGGLYFTGLEDFAEVLHRLMGDASLRESLAENGKEYVEKKYNWDAVLERFESVMKQLTRENVENAENKE